NGGGEREDLRPEAKVILLCGPPGMGKTTLAQVVARHAGYRTEEVNASDDRSAPVLREKVIRAMESRAAFGDCRPRCIILDEVDGADGKGAVQAIVDIVQAPLRSGGNGGGNGGNGGGNGGRRGKAAAHPLLRPLILICNDPHAAHLRPIRALAQVFIFRQTNAARLTQRLKVVCAAERLPVNVTALAALAEATGNDIRCCLNTLQFASYQGGRAAASGGSGSAAAVSAALMEAVEAGIKDERKDAFQVRYRKCVSGGSAVAASPSEEVMDMVEAYNDSRKLMQGVHENLLGVPYNDPTLKKA
ncbi:unnamed protein product, partial [Phaeothamnion confervicola]